MKNDGRAARLWRRPSGPWLVAFLLVLIGALRIVATYSRFSQTSDEAVHIACGMQWLQKGAYSYDTQHPPLARIAVALGPRLAGTRLPAGAEGDPWTMGNELLGDKSYFRSLSLARLGVLPFYLLCSVTVWIWTRRLFGAPAALAATLVLTTLPNILAHAGLATTDMALAATLTLSVATLAFWLDTPPPRPVVVLMAVLALAILAKFSALVFIPACAAALLACKGLMSTAPSLGSRPPEVLRRGLLRLGMGTIVACLVLWAGYLFSIGSITEAASRPHLLLDGIVGSRGSFHDFAYAVVEDFSLPMPELVRGLVDVYLHNQQGHRAFLLGEISQHGWWYYFPVVYLSKAPLAFLMLVGIGTAEVVRQSLRHRAWQPLVPLLSAASIMFASLFSNINIGVRHVLPVDPMLSIIAGFGAVCLWTARRRRHLARALCCVLLFWQGAASAAAHPDYLAYFNELVASPEKVAVDSNLDWGQDLPRLRRELDQRAISELALAYFGTADLDVFGLSHARKLAPHEPQTGWIAISHNVLSGVFGQDPPYDGYDWLEAYEPETLVGESILLYHVP